MWSDVVWSDVMWSGVVCSEVVWGDVVCSEVVWGGVVCSEVVSFVWQQCTQTVQLSLGFISKISTTSLVQRQFQS